MINTFNNCINLLIQNLEKCKDIASNSKIDKDLDLILLLLGQAGTPIFRLSRVLVDSRSPNSKAANDSSVLDDDNK